MKTLSMKRLGALGLGAAMTLGAANVVLAGPSNLPPPAGAILDLAPGLIPHDGNNPQSYSVNFVAGQANTAITFAFREDPAFIFFFERLGGRCDQSQRQSAVERQLRVGLRLQRHQLDLRQYLWRDLRRRRF